MTEPEFELPDDPSSDSEKRAGVSGWVALWLVLALIVGYQLNNYLTRKPTLGSKTAQTAQAFKTAVLSKEALKRYGSMAGSEAEAVGGLDDAIAEIVEDRKTDVSSARLYVAMRFEQGHEIKPEDLSLLAKSAQADERAFAEIYASKSLDRNRAEDLAAKLDKRRFSYRMAEIHALEKAGDKQARKRLITEGEVLGQFVFGILVLGALLIGTVVLVFYFAMRLSGRFKPEGHPAGNLTAEQANVFAGTAAGFFFLFLLAGFPTYLALGGVLSSEAVSAVAEATMVVGVFLILGRYRHALGPSLKSMGWDRKRFWGDVAWGIGGFFANVPMFLCCALVGQRALSGLPPPEHPMTTQLAMDQSPVTVMLMLFIASVLAPLFEEFTFRGTILPAMVRLFGGPFPGIVATSLLFAAIHPTGIPVWPALAMIGGMAAMLVYQRKSVVPAMVFHGCHNLALLIMTLILF